MVTILGFSIYWIRFVRSDEHLHDPTRNGYRYGSGTTWSGGRSKAEKVEAPTRPLDEAEKVEAADAHLIRTSRAPTRAPRSTPHCVHPSNEHPRTVKDRFEPFPRLDPRRAGGRCPTTLTAHRTRTGVRGRFEGSSAFKFNKIQETYADAGDAPPQNNRCESLGTGGSEPPAARLTRASHIHSRFAGSPRKPKENRDGCTVAVSGAAPGASRGFLGRVELVRMPEAVDGREPTVDRVELGRSKVTIR
jgi:hypothetical protein